MSKTRNEPVPGLLIAAPSSNSGKTVITLGILRALLRRGQLVAAAKAGPDYIDPAFQQAASQRRCINLDPWAMAPEAIEALARWHVGPPGAGSGDDGGFLLCEGVMGLFDGAAGGGGSSADLAALMNWPVVLVVDVRGQAASAAAVIQGFARFRADVRIAGVILNRVGSPRHRDLIMTACAQAIPDIPVIGAVMRDDALSLPERHLGLVQAGEHPALEAFLDRAATIMERDIDLDRLLQLAGVDILARDQTKISTDDDGPGLAHPRPHPHPQRDEQQDEAAHKAPVTIAPLGRHIAVARDDAFAFCYLHLIAGWEAAGARIDYFSPLANAAPSQDCDAVYLPGGYPELHAAELAKADRFMTALRDAARRGIPVYGECGGYMVLGDILVDGAGKRHHMAGLLPLETSFAQRRLHLGYRQVEVSQDCPLGMAGTVLRGHEFHYASTIRADGPGWLMACTADGRDLGACGLQNGSVFGSFFHLIC
ncbi:cobyrinate a,c-diamide synthase [Thalassospira sp. TSL5-1]|uniref:cobyrinate a,c-diamide synthase n=1 Tax=Thalassospira sp. TSL5-1 TaxID=1544451 RepID=UPI000939F8BC|nr:cobyrinate a,c-diamide synthase [Thalassospira sp. TSL5-1]OKH87219.1 cobyrinic acid a,c-diamide synthase [Thalassospira sp. TSL5-1]